MGFGLNAYGCAHSRSLLCERCNTGFPKISSYSIFLFQLPNPVLQELALVARAMSLIQESRKARMLLSLCYENSPARKLVSSFSVD